MNSRSPGLFKRLFRTGVLSPNGLLLRALLLVVAFAICEAAGLRAHTTFLSGTAASAGSWQSSVVWGVTYILAYLGFVLLAPILLLAAVLLSFWGRLESRGRSPHAADGVSSLPANQEPEVQDVRQERA